MASIHTDPRGKSPYWYCAYRGADGRRLFRSTKITIDGDQAANKVEKRRKAWEFCLNLERAEKEAGEGRLTESRARQLISDTMERTSGKPLKFKTTREFFDEWLSGKGSRSELSKISGIIYASTVRLFLESVGDKAEENMAHITSEDIQKFQMSRVEAHLAPKTIDRDSKIIRAGFKIAKNYGLIPFDPCLAVPFLSKISKRKAQVVTREIFTAEELDSIANAAEEEWKTAILIARYTGARLSDCAGMTWDNVHFNVATIEYSDRKTGKDYVVPLHPRLEKHLLSLASTDAPNGLLCPKLAKMETGGRNGLSYKFREIMAKAGVDDRRTATKSVSAPEKGEERQLSRRSFHAIRHSYNSQLANVGTSQEIRRKLVGHSSDDMNDVYTHLDTELFRQAIKKLS